VVLVRTQNFRVFLKGKAHFGRDRRTEERPLSGEKRTSQIRNTRSANDPGCVKTLDLTFRTNFLGSFFLALGCHCCMRQGRLFFEE
jgi:hypothetical protein